MTLSEGVESAYIQVGVSSCLLGEKVRYDGGHRLNSYVVETLGECFKFKSFCPEMSIGLGVPRETLRIIDTDSGHRCVRVNDSSFDVTEKLKQLVDDQSPWLAQICGYIFKKGSPSCGVQNVKLFRGEGFTLEARGIFVAELKKCFPLLPVIDEGMLDGTEYRESFLLRVKALHQWKNIAKGELSVATIKTFHQAVNMSNTVNMSKTDSKCDLDSDQSVALRFNELLGCINSGNENEIQSVSRQYISLVMSALTYKENADT